MNNFFISLIFIFFFLVSCTPQVEEIAESEEVAAALEENKPKKKKDPLAELYAQDKAEVEVVADYDFNGADSVSHQTRNTARLNWTAYPGAKEYYIYNTLLGVPIYVGKAIPPATHYRITGLTIPEHTYQFRVRVFTDEGVDSNTNDITFQTTGFEPPQEMSLIYPEKEVYGERKPVIGIGALTEGDIVKLFYSKNNGGDGCDQLVAMGPATSDFMQMTPDAPLEDGSYEFFVKLAYSNGTESPCSTISQNYTVDTTPPIAPDKLVWINPTQSVNIQKPTLQIFAAMPDAEILLYKGRYCEEFVGSKMVDTPGIMIWEEVPGITGNGSHVFSAKQKNNKGNTSECSTDNATVIFFNGLESITSLTDTKVTLEIPAIAKADAFQIRITGQGGGTSNVSVTDGDPIVDFEKSGLTPGGDYSVRVRAIFGNGLMDNNNREVEFEMDTAPSNPKATAAQSPDTGTYTVTISGVSPGNLVKVFSDDECNNKIGEGTATSNSITIVTQPVGDEVDLFSTAESTEVSACTRVASCPDGYIVVPADPSLGIDNDFCAMKYEPHPGPGAFISNIATSEENVYPTDYANTSSILERGLYQARYLCQ